MGAVVVGRRPATCLDGRVNVPPTSSASAADAQLPDADPANSVAVVDLGTQSALLLIARERADGSLEELEDHAFAARLGASMDSTGRLAPASVERTFDVLVTFARRIALHGIAPERVRAVGTAVLRRAREADGFVARVRAELGLPLEVIDGDAEARLGWDGAAGPDVDALVDVGGGSSEVVTDSGARVRSFDVGAGWLTETWAPERGDGPCPHEPPVDAIDAALTGAALEGARGGRVVLVGGSAVNLGCLVAGAQAFDHRVAAGVEVDAEAARTWARRVGELGLEDRLDLPVEPTRADVLPAGLWILARLLERLDPSRATVSTRGLRHGLARTLLGELGRGA